MEDSPPVFLRLSLRASWELERGKPQMRLRIANMQTVGGHRKQRAK